MCVSRKCRENISRYFIDAVASFRGRKKERKKDVRSIISRNVRRRGARFRRIAWRRRPRGCRRNFNSRALNNAYQNSSRVFPTAVISSVPLSLSLPSPLFLRPLPRPPSSPLVLAIGSFYHAPKARRSPPLYPHPFYRGPAGKIWHRVSLVGGRNLPLSSRHFVSPSLLHLFLFPVLFFSSISLTFSPNFGFFSRVVPFPISLRKFVRAIGRRQRQRERKREKERKSAVPFSIFTLRQKQKPRGSESVRGDSRIYCGRAELRVRTRGTFFRPADNVPRMSHFGKSFRAESFAKVER